MRRSSGPHLWPRNELDVDAIVTHEFALSDVYSAYDALHDRIDVKVAVIPD